jgi:hypothetical protein
MVATAWLRSLMPEEITVGTTRSWHPYVSLSRRVNPGCSVMVKLISFDIDGTLEVGDPPGIITMDMVRALQMLGYVIGSASDRPLSSQRYLWESHRMVVDFTTLKHHLADVRARFQADAYYHIGDTDMDRFLADKAGFRFVMVDPALIHGWGPEVFS